MIKKNRQIKEAKVAEIKEKLEKAQGVVLASYQGLTVEEDTMLRKSLREAGVEYKVYKNTLVTLAANELGLGDLVQYLEGPVSIAFGYEDATAPARVLHNFGKDHKKLELKAGIVDGIVYDKAGVEKTCNNSIKGSSYCKTSWKLQSSIIKPCIFIKCN